MLCQRVSCVLYCLFVSFSCENVVVMFQVFYQIVDGFLDSGDCGVLDWGKRIAV